MQARNTHDTETMQSVLADRVVVPGTLPVTLAGDEIGLALEVERLYDAR